MYGYLETKKGPQSLLIIVEGVDEENPALSKWPLQFDSQLVLQSFDPLLHDSVDLFLSTWSTKALLWGAARKSHFSIGIFQIE